MADDYNFLEIASRLSELEPIISKDKREATIKDICDTFGLDGYKTINRGLRTEKEIAILLSEMRTCKTIIRLNQFNYSLDDTIIVPDILASIYCGEKEGSEIYFKCFIEVKTTYRRKYRITKLDFNKRSALAKRFNFPLLFAIRFTIFEQHCLWGLFSCETLLENGLKLDIEDIFKLSLNWVLLDDYLIYLKESLRIVRVYNINPKGNLQSKYGIDELTAIKIYDGNDIVMNIIDSDRLILYSMLFDCFFREVKGTDYYEDKIIREDKISIYARMLSDVIYTMNHMIKDDAGNPIDYTGDLSLKERKSIVNRNLVEKLVKEINRDRLLLIRIEFGDERKLKEDIEWARTKMNNI